MQIINLKAAAIFIVAHFATVIIHNALLNQGGFVVHMSQAAVFLFVCNMAIDFKLRIAALVTVIFYALLGVNWLLIIRGIDVTIQKYFYDSFASIIVTIDLIVLFLLGKDGGIHIFNKFFSRHPFYNKIQLFYRSFDYSRLRNLNLFISTKNNQIKEKY